MMAKGKSAVLTVIVGGLLVSGALALAQPRGGGRATRGPAHQMRRTPRAAHPGGMQMAWLFAGADRIKVEQTDSGARVRVTAEEESSVQGIQTRVESVVEALGTMAEHLAQREGPVPGGRGPAGVMGHVVRGELEVSAEEIDDGAVVTFTADNPELAAQVYERLQAAAERAEATEAGPRQMRGAMQHMRRAHGLLASEKVETEVVETEKGLTVRVTSDEPEVVERIQAELKPYFQGLKDRAHMMQRWRRQGGPQAPGMPMHRREAGRREGRRDMPMHGRMQGREKEEETGRRQRRR